MEKKKFYGNKKPFDKGQRKPFDRNKKSFENKKKNEEVKNVETSVRYYAYLCLYKVFVEKAYSNIEIDHVIRENKINELDAKLLTNIVYGTLSHERLLNWEIKQLCEKTPKISVFSQNLAFTNKFC